MTTETVQKKTVFKRVLAYIRKHPYLQFVLFGLVLSSVAVLPDIGLMKNSTMSIFAYMVIYTVAAYGLNLLLGFSGLISLATAGFIGGGALGLGILLNMGWPFELAVVALILIAIVLGVVLGVLSLKSYGIYLAITTLFVGEILRQIYTSVGIFGGERIDIGAVTFLGSLELNRFDFGQRSTLFLILTAILVIMMILFYNLVNSRSGRAFMAMSRSRSAAQAMGVSIMKYRVYAFVLAIVMAFIAGIMYGIYFQSAPTRSWTLNLSLLLLAIVVVGGFKSIFGMFLGAVIIYGIPKLYLEDILGNVSEVFAGLLIIVVILFYPNGLVHAGKDIKKLIARGIKRLKDKGVNDNGERQ